MTTERTLHGWYNVTELVTDGCATWFHTERFMGYTKRDAEASFRRIARTNGWAIVGVS